MKRIVVVLIAVAIGSLAPVQRALAETWTCRNNDLEISCSDQRCAATPEGGFTPMSVTLDDAGSMTVCAYSGCWEGPAKIDAQGGFRIFTGLRLAWNGASPAPADFAVALDLSDRIAVLKGTAFAQPMSCEAAKPGD